MILLVGPGRGNRFDDFPLTEDRNLFGLSAGGGGERRQPGGQQTGANAVAGDRPHRAGPIAGDDANSRRQLGHKQSALTAVGIATR
jgi:hypothetical protein